MNDNLYEITFKGRLVEKKHKNSIINKNLNLATFLFQKLANVKAYIPSATG